VDDGHHQPLEVEVDGDAEVDVVVHDQLVLAEAGVHLGVLPDGVDHRPADEREVREAEALGGLERLALGGPHPLDALEVHLDRRVHVRRGLLRAGHVFGGAPPDVGVGDGRVALPGPRHRLGGRRGRGSRRRRRGLCRGGRGRLRGLGRRWLGGRGGCRRGRNRATLVQDRQHVVARDAPARARAHDGGGVEVVLGDEAAHDR
jgi:hypothetical protein